MLTLIRVLNSLVQIYREWEKKKKNTGKKQKQTKTTKKTSMNRLKIILKLHTSFKLCPFLCTIRIGPK